MRLTSLCMVVLLVVLGSTIQVESGRRLPPRLRRLLFRIRGFAFGQRRCITQNGCSRNRCCVREIEPNDAGDGVTFDRFGMCVKASDLLNEEEFMLNRIDDEIAAATDRAAELATQSVGQDLLIICRPGTLGPQQEDMSMRKKRGVQIEADRLVRILQGPDVATAAEVVDSGSGEIEEDPAAPESRREPEQAKAQLAKVQQAEATENEKRAPAMSQFKKQAQAAEDLLSNLVNELDTIQK
ncbi:uncharacterized protein LOC135808563 [Sycon ciliatum]|uniref:uncharacterized protein LOC135808563 n=1 Tax=Sycon ciliatum TaxID=27933 RepID=UPI0020A95D52|eukprot:scpid48611/ scgid29956/ 